MTRENIYPLIASGEPRYLHVNRVLENGVRNADRAEHESYVARR